MKKEDLMKFCSPDRSNITEPFSIGKFTYATNGHILIRVPLIPEILFNPKSPNPETSVFSKTPNPVEWFDIPAVKKPELEKTVTCWECGGTGIADCPTCGKPGHECDECDGTGEVTTKPLLRSTKINGLSFDEKYLYLIKDLPNVKISPTQHAKAAWFKFDGGDGLLMPLNM